MIKQEHHPGSLNGESTHRVLGAVTALAWFAEDHGRCLSALWEPLQSAGGNALRSFFRAPTFSRAYRLTRGKLALVPLVPPKTLEQAIEANVFGHGFYTPDGPLWQSWTWERLTDSALDDHRRFGGQLDRWYRRSFKSIWEDADQAENPEAEEDLDLRGIRQQAWRAFIDKLWGEKSLLLFAQRKWIHRWFENYDPTNVDPLDEADRPWDFDHIHPASHIESKRNIPQRIRAWHGSIGNLRAWPLQANRGDGASSPWTKLSSDRALEMLQPFGITTHEQLADASFLNEEERSYFEGSTPDDDTFVSGYLGRPAEFGKQRIQLVNAIVRRWLRLYRSWYEALRIEDLGP